VYNPKGLPVRDPSLEEEPKVVELRALTHWSDGKRQRTVCLLIMCGLRIKFSLTCIFSCSFSTIRSHVGVSAHIFFFVSNGYVFVVIFINHQGTHHILHCYFFDCELRSPEMHGTITGVFKNQIDWIPLNTGSVRPTQGKTWYVSS
jgi:hypothetical protein